MLLKQFSTSSQAKLEKNPDVIHSSNIPYSSDVETSAKLRVVKRVNHHKTEPKTIIKSQDNVANFIPKQKPRD